MQFHGEIHHFSSMIKTLYRLFASKFLRSNHSTLLKNEWAETRSRKLLRFYFETPVINCRKCFLFMYKIFSNYIHRPLPCSCPKCYIGSQSQKNQIYMRITCVRRSRSFLYVQCFSTPAIGYSFDLPLRTRMFCTNMSVMVPLSRSTSKCFVELLQNRKVAYGYWAC